MTTLVPTPGTVPGALPVMIAPLALDPAAVVALNRWAAGTPEPDTRPWYRKVWAWFLLVPGVLLGLLVVIALIGAIISAATANATPTLTRTAPTITAPTVVQESPVRTPIAPETTEPTIIVPIDPARSDAALSGIYGAGTYVVGRDIQPGNYWTRGPDYGRSATWQRLSATDGAFDSIITSGIAEGPTQITISKDDAAVKLTGGAVWTTVS
jgi:hypothetical protein